VVTAVTVTPVTVVVIITTAVLPNAPVADAGQLAPAVVVRTAARAKTVAIPVTIGVVFRSVTPVQVDVAPTGRPVGGGVRRDEERGHDEKE
jgi:hypothetical protein